MSVDARLEAVPVVDIDNAGVFKYILIKVSALIVIYLNTFNFS